MPTVASDELELQPERFLDDNGRGTSDVIPVHGELVMLTLPLRPAARSSAERLMLAVSLDERDVLRLVRAAKIARLSHMQMLGELGRRQIPVVRDTALKTLT